MLKSKEPEHRRDHGKMERIRKEKEVYGMRRSAGSHRSNRLGIWLVVLATCCLAGCTTLKKAGVTSLGAGTGAIVGSVLSGGAAAPILGATTGAFVTDVVTELKSPAKPQATVLHTEQGMIECAPDNFWSLLGSLVSSGGTVLICFLIISIALPMLLGWILPGPLERKKKQRNLFS